MSDAVIVSTARTGLAKSWRGCRRSHDHVQGWTAMDSSGEFFSTEDLASHLLKIYVDRWLEQHLPRGE